MEYLLPDSERYFLTPSPEAKKLFYYLLVVGHYKCINGYHIKRDNFGSILLMYVLDGEETIVIRKKTYYAKKNDIILINCYEPHEYFTTNNLDILWAHFDGGKCLEFFDSIFNSYGPIFSCNTPNLFVDPINSILNVLRNKQILSEPSVCCIIQTILCNLISNTLLSGSLTIDNVTVKGAIKYIQNNITNKILIVNIAENINMSASNFYRIFKKEMGITPYEYIIKTRIDLAKKLLRSTSTSISIIGCKVGFSSTSNFISYFHSRVGLSPQKFRAIPF